MIRRRPHAPFAAVTLGALSLALARPALAYDSAGPDITPQTHKQPTPMAPWPFGAPYFQAAPDYSNDAFIVLDSAGGTSPYSTANTKPKGLFNFQLRMLHDALGSAAAYGGDPDVSDASGVLLCKWPRDSTQPGFGDWNQCTTWPASMTAKMPGWVKVHRAWNTRTSGSAQNTESPEHMDIALASAQAAGLGSLPLFTQTLWVRYPVNGTWLTTFEPPPKEPDPVPWVTAPSWNPVDFPSMGALATRGVRLAELAQLPDVANAVWDWASGDEVCPVNGIDTVVVGQNGTPTTYSAFGNTARDLNLCHDFTSVMGAINASHFMPLAQTYYHYYHALALTRVAQCLDMSRKLAPVYAVQADDPRWQAYRSPNDSEVNVCEAEAFAYEMNAQHYLQDAWSTGHMWSRWGYPDLAPFPSNVATFPSTGTAQPANEAARRMVIAGSLASYAGTIHGAKGVTGSMLSWAPSLIDDPLCGPAYDDPGNAQPQSLLVQWISSDQKPHAGVGDLFYNPYTGANLSSDSAYSAQREHMVACGARSLYDVYTAGPQSYGGVTPGSVEGLSVTDASLSGATFDDTCFGQRATNASMSGALGAFYMSRDWEKLNYPLPFLTPNVRDAIFTLVNKLLVAQRGSQVFFTDPLEETAFLTAAVNQLGLDVQVLKALFNARAVLDPNGTASAQLVGAAPGTQLTMLGVPPNSPPAPGQPPSAFVDQLSSVPTGAPQDSVRRLFWRAHPEDVCAQELVNTLRSRCIAGAAFGGDAEACTACVDIAELQVPTCSTTQTGGGGGDAGAEGGGGPPTSPVPLIGPSKCSALDPSVQTDALPTSWWDPAARTFACDTFPSYWLAFSYCTGTDPLPFEGNTDYVFGRTQLGTADQSVSSACVDPLTQQPRPLVTVTAREAYAHRELNTTTQTVRPVVIAWNQVETEKEIVTQDASGIGCEDYFTSDKDAFVQSLVPFPLWTDSENHDPALLSEDTLSGLAPYTLPFCGTSQRLTVWNRSCPDVMAQFEFDLGVGLNPQATMPLDPTTGIEALSVQTWQGNYAGEERCSLREARTFSMACPPLMTCSSSGVCVPGRDATGMPVGGVPPPPQIVVRP